MKYFILAFSLCLISLNIFSQCAMCKGIAESSVQEGSMSVFGLNMGILYMFAMPYILICTIGYFWWKQSKAKKENLI